MSREVDDRVVSMSFDNKKFEANVKESMSTIDKLKEKLNFDNVKDSFSHIERGFQKFDVSPVTKGIDKVKVSFSSLQVAGATVISELTKKIMGIGTTFTNTFKGIIGQIKSGGMSRALNYESGKFQMGALGIQWDDIKDSISKAVVGTPFGGDEATRVAAQIVTAGVKLGDEMDKALRGVSGVAAMTNSAYSEIGDIFVDVAGQGKVTGDTLMRLSTRGMNAAATLGKALGKTEAEIREMTRKGQIDFKTFAKAMDDAFGEHATAANETYSGSLANMKSALSRLGQKIAEPNLNKLRDIFNAIHEAVDSLSAALDPVINVLNDFFAGLSHIGVRAIETFNKSIQQTGETFTSLSDKLKGFLNIGTPLIDLETNFNRAGISTKKFKKTLMETAKEHGVNVKKMIKEDGTYRNSLKRGWLTNEIFEESVNKMIKTQKKNKKASAEQIEMLKNYRDQVGKTGSMVDQNLKMMKKDTGGQLIVKSLTNILTTLSDSLRAIKDAYAELFPEKSTFTLYSLIEIFNKFTKKLKLNETQLDRMKRIFKGLFATMDLVHMVTKGVITGFETFLKIISRNNEMTIGEFVARIADLIVKFHDWVKENDTITGIFNALATVLGFVVGKIADFINLISNSEAFKTFASTMTDIFKGFGKKGWPFVKDLMDLGKSKIAEVFEKIKDFLEGNETTAPIVEKFENFVQSLKDCETVGEKVQTVIKGIWDLIKDVSSAAWNLVKGGIGKLVEKIKEFVSKVDWGIVMSTILGAFTYKLAYDILDMVKILKGPFAAFEEFISTTGEALEATAKNFGTVLKAKAFEEIAKGILIMAGAIAILAAACAILGKDNVIAAGSVIFAVSIAMGVLFIAISKLGSSGVKFKTVAGTIISIAVGIGIMAVALGVLIKAFSEMDINSLPKLIGAVLGSVVALGLLGAVLVGLTNAAQTLLSDGKLPYLSKSLVPIAVGIGILSGSLYLLTKVADSGKLLAAAGAIGIVMIAIAAVAKILQVTKIAFVQSSTSAMTSIGMLIVALMGLSASMIGFAVAITLIAKSNLAKTAKEGMGNIIAVLVVMASVFLTTRLLGKEALKSGVAIFAIGGALLALAVALNMIKLIKLGTILKGLLYLIPTLLVLGAVLELMVDAGKDIHKAGLAALGIAGAIILMTASVAALGMIKTGTLIKGVGAIIALMAGLALVMVASKSFEGKGEERVKALIAIASIVGVFAAAIAALALIKDLNRVVAAAGILTGVLAVVAGFMYILGKVEAPKKGIFRTLLIMSLVIVGLSAITAAIGAIVGGNITGMIAGAGAVLLLALAMIPLSEVLTILGQSCAGISAVAGPLLKTLGIMAVIFVGLGLIVVALSHLVGDWKSAIAGAASVAILATALLPIMMALESLTAAAILGPVIMKLIPALLMVGAVLLALTGITFLLSKMDVGPSTLVAAAAVTALAFAMVPLAAALDLLIPVGAAAVPVLAGILVLSAAMLALTGVFAIIGGLATDGSNIIKGATIIGQAIGALVGGVINGFATALFDPKLSTTISAFMAGLMPFLMLVQTLNAKMLTGSLILAGVMLIFGAAGAIAGFLGLAKASSSLVGLGAILGSFGLAIQPFLMSLTSVTEAQLNGASLLAEIMMQFAKDAIISGVAMFVGGGMGLVVMGMQLSAMGLAMQPFLNMLSDPKMATAVVGAALLSKVLLTMSEANLLNSLDQLVNKIFGTSVDWSWFESLGSAVAGFAKNTEGLSDDAVQRAKTCAGVMTQLIEASNNMPREGGLKGMIIGKRDLSDFGESMGSFIEMIQGIDTVKFNAVTLELLKPLFEAMKTLIGFANDIPDTQAGLFDKFDGFADLGDFGLKLQNFASQFQQIGSHLAGMDEAKIEKVRAMGTSAKVLAEVANTISKVGTTEGSVGTLTSFGGDIEGFAKHYSAYAESLAAADKKNPKKNTQKMKETLKLLMEDMAKTDVDSSKANKAMEEAGKTNVDSLLNGMTSAIDGKSKDVKTKGMDLAKYLPEGADKYLQGDGLDKIQSGVKGVTDKMSGTVSKDGVKSQGFDIGSFFDQGLANGITSGEGGPVNSVSKLVNKVINKAKEVSDEHSPSKVFMTIGGYLSEGLAIGIGDEEDTAVKAVSKMMSKTIKKAQKDMKYGKKVLKTFGNLYFDDDSMKKQKQYTRATKAASNAIKALGWSLYKNSDYFKQDKDAIKNDRKQIKEYNKQLKELRKHAKKNKSEIKSMKKQIKDAKKQLKQDVKGVAKHVKQAFNDTRNGIANTLRSFMDISNAAFDSGQNIFEKYYSPDAATIEEHKAAVEELTAYRDNLNEQIQALEGINTRASQKQLSDLKEELEGVNSELDQAQQTLDDDNAIDRQDMIDNLVSNAQGLEDYLDNLYALDMSGFNTSFIKKLKEMGIEGNNYIVAALSMNQEEMDEINASYERFQHDQAEFFVNNFRQNMKTVMRHGAILDQLADKGFNDKAIKAMQEMGMDMDELGSALLTMTDEEVKAFNKEYGKSLELDTKVADEIMASYARAGANSAKGFAEGISKGTKGAEKAAKKLAKKTVKAVKKELGIKSPSRVFAEIADYCNQGFANGLEFEDMASTISEMVDRVFALLDSESGNTQPVISPVVDMTNVENANGMIDDLLTNDRLVGSTSMAISTNMDTTNMQLANFQTSMEDNFASLQNLLNGYLENSQNATVTNNFNINSSSPKEVANEVSRILQKQVERRQATWA